MDERKESAILCIFIYSDQCLHIKSVTTFHYLFVNILNNLKYSIFFVLNMFLYKKKFPIKKLCKKTHK